MSATITPETAEPGRDPVDDLDIDITADDPVDESPLPDHLILGGKPQEEPEVVEPEAKQPEKSEPVLPEGYTKDAKGRVHRPDGTLASKDELAKLATAPQQQPTTDQPAVEPRKFAYRSLAQTHEPEGFTENADGTVTVSAEQVGLLRAAFNAKHVMEADTFPTLDRYKSENAALQQEVESLKTGTNAEVAKSRALVESYVRLLSEPDDEKFALAAFKLREQFPVLLARAEADHYKKLATEGKPSRREPTRPTGDESPYRAEPLPPAAKALEATADHIEHIKLEPQYRDLSEKDWKQFSDRASRTPYAYLRPATAADAQWGVRVGEIVLDRDAFARDIQEYAVQIRGTRETAEKRAKLAADNARRTQAGIDAPPTPGGGSQPAKAPKRITSEKDFDDWLNSDEL